MSEYQENFRLIMISAMYENGGNTIHRLFDGHPQLFTYPFESQLGNSQISDALSSLFPFKYRYPEFPMGRAAAEYYEMFFDEELKSMARSRHVSKFRDADFTIDEGERRRAFAQILEGRPVTRGTIVAAFFEATFRGWTNRASSGREAAYVGYSPVIGFDAEKILADFAKGHVVHIVRNPWSGYADTKKRPFPLSIDRYAWLWSLMQHHALVFAKMFPDRFHIVRFEDLVADRMGTMRKLASRLEIAWDDSLLAPTWNGAAMGTVYPWGTIRTPTTEANLATMNELTKEQKGRIAQIAALMLGHFGYEAMA